MNLNDQQQQFTAHLQALQQQIEQLQAQQALQAQQPAQLVVQQHRSVLKPAKPDTFDGSKANRLDAWLFQLGEYFDICGVNQASERVAYAGSMLRGSASTWWRQQRTRMVAGGIANIQTWEEFCAGIRAQYALVNSIKVARDALAALKQTTSVQAYAQRFRDITLQIPGITEAEQLDRFVRGLKPRLQKEIAIRDPTTVEEAIRMSERIDVVEFSWRQQQFGKAPTDNSQRPVPMELGNIDDDAMELGAINRQQQERNNRPLSNGFDNRNPLTLKEREELRKKKACFKCRQTGHMARSCPERMGN